jgi:hypothetical protein
MSSFTRTTALDRVIDAAKRAGYIVTRSQSSGRLSLNIARNPQHYEYIAHFRRNPHSGHLNWSFAQHIVDGEYIRIFTLGRFLDLLADVKADAQSN